jgi:hypothetical protein
LRGRRGSFFFVMGGVSFRGHGPGRFDRRGANLSPTRTMHVDSPG